MGHARSAVRRCFSSRASPLPALPRCLAVLCGLPTQIARPHTTPWTPPPRTPTIRRPTNQVHRKHCQSGVRAKTSNTCAHSQRTHITRHLLATIVTCLQQSKLLTHACLSVLRCSVVLQHVSRSSASSPARDSCSSARGASPCALRGRVPDCRRLPPLRRCARRRTPRQWRRPQLPLLEERLRAAQRRASPARPVRHRDRATVHGQAPSAMPSPSLGHSSIHAWIEDAAHLLSQPQQRFSAPRMLVPRSVIKSYNATLTED